MIVIGYDGSPDAQAAIDHAGELFGGEPARVLTVWEPFIELIAKYVAENDIEKPDDFVMKSVVNKSVNKVYIIQQVDKKIPLETIAKNKDLRLDALLDVLPRPDPLFLPPPSSLLTVAQARRAASLLDTPRFS